MTKRRRRRKRGPIVRIVVALVLLAGAVALVTVVVWHDGGPLGRPLPRASLLFTCDLQGKLVPRACEEGSLGGVARLASLFETWSQEHADSLVVDVGNATVADHDKAEIINRFALQALDQLGCVVANCGVNEAALPRDQLVATAGLCKLKLISANVIDAASGNPALPPYHIVSRGGVRVAFIGLVRADLDKSRVGKGLQIIEPANALRDALNSVEGEADVVVVLAHLPPAVIYDLARTYTKVRIFLGGDAPASSAPYELVRTIVTRKRGGPAGGRGATARPEVKDVLVAYLSDQGHVAGQLEAVFPRNRFPLVNAQMRRIDDGLDEAPAMEEVVAQFLKAVPEAERPGAHWDPKMPCTSSIVGAEVCKLCHTNQFYDWQDTDHAGAYVTLLQQDATDEQQGIERERKRHTDPECLQCHTTGYGMPDGFLDKARVLETAQDAVRKLDLYIQLRDLEQRGLGIADEAEKKRLEEQKADARQELAKLAHVRLGKLRLPEDVQPMLQKLEIQAALDALAGSDAPDAAAKRQALVTALRGLQHVNLGQLGEAEKAAVAKHAKERLKALDALKNVGCEACHGGARRHVGLALKDKTAAARTPYQRDKVSARNCIRCHRTERPCLPVDTADPFNLEDYLDKISHWAGAR